MDSISQSLQDEISELLRPHRVCVLTPVLLNSQPCARAANRFVALSLWRGYLITSMQPVRVDSTFSYLEICSITIHSLSQIVLQTDRQTLSFSVLALEELEAVLTHLIWSLKRIFPDSSPGKLIKSTAPDLQLRLLTLTSMIEEQLSSQPGPCGGFSDTYAALCEFNELPFREEIQWDVHNIYYINNRRQFKLQDFSHLESRDLALAVAALSFNQWFTKIYCKDLKLSTDVQQQLTFLLSRSPSLEQLSLENTGLKPDFAIKMAGALHEHTSSTLQYINLSGNPIEDKGVIALSQELGDLAEGLKHLSLSRVSMTAKGVGCLSQVLSSTQLLSESLTHLDLSANPGSLLSEEATFLFKFFSSTNALSHLDLSDTNCPLDTLFVSLSAGCCYKLIHLNLARNPFSHRKVREVTRSIGEFFSQSCELKYVGLSATKLPPQALRVRSFTEAMSQHDQLWKLALHLMKGLATNTGLFGLELDLSSCELCSAGAQVIQEHISEARAIRSLDISDNGFENDMVTLVLSVGRCTSLRHLALGKNFAMKSRALTDVLQRIAQLIQDEECPLRSLSVVDSKLKAGTHILLSALGGRAALDTLDISGNNIGDTGAKMLAKALVNNTRLRSLAWDRNNVTAKGFQDVADAMERNLSLQQLSLPLADVTQSCRSNPDRTREALHKIQQCLDRNNQRQSDRVEPQQMFGAQECEKLQGLCGQLEESLQRVTHCNIQEKHPDILTAQEVLSDSREAFKLLPSLYEAGRTCASGGDFVNCILSDTATALTNEFNRGIQESANGLMLRAEAVCPRLVQRSSVCQCVSDCVSSQSRQAHTFLRSRVVEHTGQLISSKLRELNESLSVSLAESIIEQVVQDLTMAQDKMDCLIKENSSIALKINIPELRLVDCNFPTDDYSPAFWRDSFHSKSLRPAPSIKSLQDADWEQQSREREAERERRCGLPRSPAATPLSVPRPSPSPPLCLAGWKGRRQCDAAAGASFIPLQPVFSAAVPEREAAGRGHLPRREAPFPGCGPSTGPLPGPGSPASLMDPLPTQGQTLRHYTASRPRPRRAHTQPPSFRPQEPVSKAENESSEEMGRVDEGVEEFFTKKIIPDYALKGRWEESNPAQATPPETSSTPPASTPFPSLSDGVPSSSPTATVPCPPVPSPDTTPCTHTDAPPLSSSLTPPDPITPPPTKNIKKKFGDFFAFKRARAGRATRAGGGEGGGEGLKVKRTSIADLIRPLREARDREREKGRGAGSVEDANLSNDATNTEGSSAATATTRRTMAPVKSVSMVTPPSETSPHIPTSATFSTQEEEEEEGAAPERSPSPVTPGQDSSAVLMRDTQPGGAPQADRRLKLNKRTLREGKSQSLILLTGLEPEDKEDTHSRKHASESTSTFEQRLQVMLHRMGVVKTPPADTRSQKRDEEMRKANSEGAILDKPEPPPTYLKPRTMSTSSAEPRHPVRVLEPILRPDRLPPHPKPTVPDRPRPAVAAKPPLPTPPPTHTARPCSAPPHSSNAEAVQLRAPPPDGRPAQNGSLECIHGATLSPTKKLLPSALSPWRASCAQERSEKAQSVTDESFPKPRVHTKPLPQRRAVSVHEDTLTMTQELKAVLQRSPIRFRGNRGDLPTCSEDPSSAEEAQRAQGRDRVSDTGKQSADERGRPGCCGGQQQEDTGGPCPTAPLSSAAPALLSPTVEKPPVSPAAHIKSPSSTAPSCPRSRDKLLVSPPPTQENPPSKMTAASEKKPPACPLSHTEKNWPPGTMQQSKSTQQRGAGEHTTEPAHKRPEPPLSE